MKYNLIIGRFSEIATKSPPVRKRLIRILVKNVKEAMLKNKIKAKVYAKYDRVFIETNEIKKSIKILTHIFGLVSVSPAIKIKLSDLDEVIKKYSFLAKNKKFAVRVRRVGIHDFTSKEMEAKLGDLIIKNARAKVDLKKPNITFFLDIRNEEVYLFFKIIKCPGGMPVGSEQKVFCEIKNKRDMVASWLMLKKGCKLVILPKISIKPLNKWLYGYHKIIKKGEEVFYSNLPIVSGNTLSQGFIKTDKIVFYPIFCLKNNEIEKIYKKIKS